MRLNKRQKAILAKLFWDSSLIFIAIVVIGNAVKPDIPVIRSVIALALAIVFAVIGFVILGSIDDESTKK